MAIELTAAKIALIDILSNRILTYVTTLKSVPGMDQAQVDAETAKYEELSDAGMTELDTH